jgi:YD repeat-containing protein
MVQELQAYQSNQSFVTYSYRKRGGLKQIGSSYGDLVGNLVRDADGLVHSVTYGDAAQTTTAYQYDLKRRLTSVQSYRGPPPHWGTATTGYPTPGTNGQTGTMQLLLEDVDYVYDNVDNPIQITDWRNPAEWPAGAKPVSRTMQYDNLYRLNQISYSYTASNDD